MHQLGLMPLAAHAIAKARVIVTAAAHGLHLRHDMRGLAGMVAIQVGRRWPAI